MKPLALLTALLLPLPLFAADPLPPAGSKDLRQLLQEGLFEEEANRDLEKAAAAYAGIVARYGEQRALAATALFRLAEIRVKQDKKDEASALFQQLLTDFPSQEVLGKEARARLAALGAKVPPAWSPETVAKLEQELIALRVAESSLSTSLRPQHPKMIALREKIAATEKLLHPEAASPSALEAPTEAEAKELAVVREMAKNSPDLLNAVTDGKTTPLVRAAGNGWLEVARFLLDHGARLDAVQKVEPPLYAAARNGHKAVVELLLARGADVNAKFFIAGDRTALIQACENDRAEVARLLVDRGAELNAVTAFGTTALHGASAAGNLPLVKFLLERGADPNATPASQSGTPLLKAVELRQEAIVKLLLEFHADPNLVNSPQGRAPLHAAVREESASMIEQLLAQGAKIDLADFEGLTALHFATRWPWKPALVRLLLDRGASPHLRMNGTLFTPLHYSVVSAPRGNEALREINERGAELRQTWEALLAKGADINAQDAEGKTVLHHAMAWEQLPPENALWLIDHGADWKLEDNNHTTPLDYATNGERRFFLDQRLIFPKLVKDRTVAIAIRRRNYGGETIRPSLQAETDSAPPPPLAEVLRRALVPEQTTSKEGLSVIQRMERISGEFGVIVLRAAADASLQPAARFAIKIGDPKTDATQWPGLSWGDVVVLLNTNQSGNVLSPAEIDAWLTTLGFPPNPARPAPVGNPELKP